MIEKAPSKISSRPMPIFKEGTSRVKGKDARKANIIAAKVVAEYVRSALGPKGMNKMLVRQLSAEVSPTVTITNDGATILEKMDIHHPAARMLIDVAKTQDDEVGDGTIAVVILVAELLSKAEKLIDKGVHPTLVVEGYNRAAKKSLQILDELAIKVSPTDRRILKEIAVVSQQTKILKEYSDQIADIAVDAAVHIAERAEDGYRIDIDDIKVTKKLGESLSDIRLIEGLVLDEEVINVNMPKRIEKPRIALLRCPVEIERPEFNPKIFIENPEQMRTLRDKKESLLRSMVDKIASTGANVVVCLKSIDDVAQQLMAKRGIAAIQRARDSDAEKLAKSTGGAILSSIDDLEQKHLGYADLFEERKFVDKKLIFIEGCKDPKALSIFIRGATEEILDEAERSIHDSLCVVRNVVRDPRIVVGGGAVEVEVASRLRRWSEQISGKEQLAAASFAEALEAIPLILAENAGLDPTDILLQLRAYHYRGEKAMGIDALSGRVTDMATLNIYEALAVKEQLFKSASEASVMILRIDDVITSKAKDESKHPAQ